MQEAPGARLKEFLENGWGALEQEDLSSADYYFNSYAHFSIHEEMLKDHIRTKSYEVAIVQNKHLFKDKIVMDVGSGTGILCLFAAKAGAKHVYGIECSDILHIARKIADSNNMGDRITYLHGKAEEVELPEGVEVDILLSEWMGYFLLYESMLDTVLYCRNKWLKPGGLIFPDRVSLHLAGIEDREYKEEKIGYWGNVYGFDYNSVKKCVMEDPIVDVVDSKAVATEPACILELDLNTCQVDELQFATDFELVVKRKDFVHAFVAWFDVCFSKCHVPVSFTTGPFGKYTHWKQTVFYIEDELVCHKGDALRGSIAVRKNSKHHRDLDIKLHYEFSGRACKSEKLHMYRLR
eukprot:Polyplicarium_translucidae@DN2343_c0_g1_i1.p1